MSFAYYCCQCWWCREADERDQEPVVDAPCPRCGHGKAQRQLWGEDFVRMSDALQAACNAMNVAVMRLQRDKLKEERG